jgi:eukaryotic-like serine/threonine-protein kinase
MSMDEFKKGDGDLNAGQRGESNDSGPAEIDGGKETTHNSESNTRELASPSLVGSRLGDYQVLRKLGRGGMADVYAARQLSLGREVALKVLRPDFARDNDYIQRFRREARAAAKLNHPNIVQVYEVGSVDSIHYLVQELIDGENLRQSLDRKGVIGTEEAIEVLVGVASALEVASEAGITHRDIKPENVMRSLRGLIKVADFGLARIGTDVDATQSNLTQVGLTLGTPRYMSPEQVQGKSVDTRSDLYSLGITVYHLLAGRPPFEAEDSLALALMHLHETPVPLDRNRARYNSDGDPDLPEWLIAVISRLMSKLPQDRFQSPSELLDAIRNEAAISSLGGLGVGTAAATIRLQRATEQKRKRVGKRSVTIAAAILLPVVCGGIVWWLAAGRTRQRVNDLLSSEVVTQADSVDQQYIMAMYRNDEAAWRSVMEFFPVNENATNAAYHAKASLQLSRLFIGDGRLNDAKLLLESLLQEARVDQVYQALALAQLCQLLGKLERAEEFANARREFQTMYSELGTNNPEAERLIDQTLPAEMRLTLGIDDS